MTENYPSYQAPSSDSTAACWPSADEVDQIMAGNRHQLERSSCRWLGVSLADIRVDTRRACMQSSVAYEAWYQLHGITRDVKPEDASQRPIIVSGHQPELFHPGVWFKNFLLSEFAQKYQGFGFNILIDHDLARGTRIEVPSQAADGRLKKTAMPIAADLGNRPWELSVATDRRQILDNFSAIQACLAKVAIQPPMLNAIIPYVEEAMEQGRSLGEGLAAGRHIMELRHGLRNFELPFSHLTSLWGWKLFVGEILSRIETFLELYNQALHAYRLHHRIRNQAQPLPPLERRIDWLEAPFWIYSKLELSRKPLWVRHERSIVELSDGAKVFARIEVKESTADGWIAALSQLTELGIAIRPRALTTTLFLRLALADLMIHGIGGGKYDQVTDRIMHRFWNISPPAFVVATATFHLPYTLPVSPPFIASTIAAQRLRNWEFSPEQVIATLGPEVHSLPGNATHDSVSTPLRHGKHEASSSNAIASATTLASLLDAKRKLIHNTPDPTEKPAWHAEIQRINKALRSCYPNLLSVLRDEYASAIEYEHEQRLKQFREFSFALFPESLLVRELQKLAAAMLLCDPFRNPS